MIVNLLDKLLDFFASLKLAIFLILSLAFYLAAATCYEARYGTRAVQDVIYTSRPFVLLMAMLAINVMAAVLVRYPWKRKQTGFIITHIGIETLLLGCLLSFRYSIDGRVSLQPGQKSESINLNDEEVGVVMTDAGGRQRRHVFPVQLWHEAGYPGLARYVVGAATSEFSGALEEMGFDHLSQSLATNSYLALPAEARWPESHTVSWNLGPGAKLSVLDWMPAAVPQTNLKASPDGFPAAIVHLGGKLPNGMPMDQTIPMIADGQGGGMVRPFGGTLELDLWKARSPDEVQEFMNPPKAADLPELGRVAIYLSGKRYTVDITKDSLNKEQALGDSGFKASIEDYVLHAPPPALPENHGAEAMATEPIDPQIKIRLTGPQGTKRYLLAAWHPQFMAPFDDSQNAQHGAASKDDPLIYYWHPQTYVTTTEGTRGRLQLMQTADGKLIGRLFKLTPSDPFEVGVGKEMPNFWNTISLTIQQHETSGVMVNDYRPAHVEPRQMDQHIRAIKVAVDMDGVHTENWLALGDQPVEISTPRGPVDIDYNFREYVLGFSVGLEKAEQTNDPGSNSAATYTSQVAVMGTDSSDGSHIITMNEPLTVSGSSSLPGYLARKFSGLTFYQSGFANEQGTIFSTLSVRYDPGWIIKYLGCAFIVGGIFTMFYMKAYFQKTPAPKQAAKFVEERRPRAVKV